MAPRVFPQQVRQMQASPAMRIRHEMWHFVRAVWNNPQFVSGGGRQFLDQLGWALPGDRAPFDENRHLLLDNAAGEDFLFMHRDMIHMTNMALGNAGEGPITRWDEVPGPGDAETPVPPAWQYNDPSQSAVENQNMTAMLQRIKSDAYFTDRMQVRARFFEDPGNLSRISLGALGNLVEMTIHNAMHMRWAEEPTPYRTQSLWAVLTGQDSYDNTWDGLGYDYLGDTFSSHVNPHFWYLHGWVDGLIDRWAAANDMAVQDIVWTGTWLGGPDLLVALGLAPPVPAPAASVASAESVAKAREAASGLAELAELADLRVNLFERVMAVEMR